MGCFALLAMMLVRWDPNSPGRARRKTGAGAKSRKERAALALLAVALGGVVLIFVIPPVAQIVFGEIMLDRGYAQCPDDWLDRHAPIRWARPGTNCPR